MLAGGAEQSLGETRPSESRVSAGKVSNDRH